MRYLILSDIHANWEGLQAVLAEAEGRYDRVVCCGDLVGYCADPNPVVEWVRDHVSLTVRGNHDKVCTGLESLEWFNPVAKQAAQWTSAHLSEANFAFTRDLERGPLNAGPFLIVHGSPVDEDEYLVDENDVRMLEGYVREPLWFFGHTHLQSAFQLHRNGVRRLPVATATETNRVVELENDSIYLINPGSAGQPRDGDPRVGYALYDSDNGCIELRRTEYDIRAVQRKIVESGLPDILAHRLELGR